MIKQLRFRILWRVLLVGAFGLAVILSVLQNAFESTVERVKQEILFAFSRIERDQVMRNVHRVEDAIEDLTANLAVKQADWANWDDAWEYVVRPQREFERVNLAKASMSSIQINFAAFLNPSGKLVYATAVDFRSGDTAEFPNSLLQLLRPGGRLLLRAGDPPRHGVIRLPEGFLLAAVAPILRTGGVGEFHGTMFFGKWLDSAEIASLGQRLHVSVRLDREMPAQVSTEYRITPRDDEWIEGRVYCSDFWGNPAYELIVSLPRVIHQQSRRTVAVLQQIYKDMQVWTTRSIVVFSLVLYLILGGILELLVLRRLDSISDDAVEAGKNRAYGKRLIDTDEKSDDEISRMTRAVNQMLQALQSNHEELARRDAALRLLFDAVPIGLLSLDDAFCIEADGISQKAMELLSGSGAVQIDQNEVMSLPMTEELAGRPLTKVLRMNAEEARRLEDYLDVYRQRLMDNADMDGLNPYPQWRLVRPDGREIWLKLSYCPIRSLVQGGYDRILVIIQENTEERLRREELEHLRAEVGLLRGFLEDPEAVRQFLEEAQAVVDALRRIPWIMRGQSGAADLADVAQMFRWVHTMHGSAATLGLEQVAHAAFRLESALASIRDGTALIPIHGESEMSSVPEVEARNALTQLDIALQAAHQMVRDLAGDLNDSPELRVAAQEIDELIALIEADAQKQGTGGPLSMAVFRLQAMRRVSAGRAFARLVRATPGFAAAQGKKAALRLKGEAISLEPELSTALAGILIHLLRNSIAHGIEYPEERVNAGKPEEGRIELALVRQREGLLIEFSDDGRGVDRERVAQIALEKGLSADGIDNDERLLDILCSPGFTTREIADGISGRGVGLDSVREQIHYLGGTLRMRTEIGRGTTFRILLPAYI